MIKYFLMSLKLMGMLAVFAGLMPSCAASGGTRLYQNLGDQLIGRLHVEMTHQEVDAVIGELKENFWEDSNRVLKSVRDLYWLYKENYFPKNLLENVEVGTPYRSLAYWTNYAGRNAGTLKLFYDPLTQRLRGWVNTASPLARDRFMHEMLTSQLKWSEGGAVKGMSHAQVHALIGEPVEIIAPPQQSLALYANHFWVSGTSFFRNQKIEVYSYALENGAKRRVYLLYYPAADELNGWGYDHAWEEVERYQREQGARSK